MSKYISDIISSPLFELVPFRLSIIDKNYNVVAANQIYIDALGQYEGKKCYDICKQLDLPCTKCKMQQVFETGQSRVSDEATITQQGNSTHTIVHFTPIKDDDGEVVFVLEMSSDLTESSYWLKEYNMLFEKVPNYITVIDKDFKIIRSNAKFRETFGNKIGTHCYEVYKKKKHKCTNCPAILSFDENTDNTSTQIGVTTTGDKTNYIVQTIPISKKGNQVDLVMEIAQDITEINKLQEQLSTVHDFYSSLIHHVSDAIIAIDKKGKTKIMNPAAKELLGWSSTRKPPLNKLITMLPQEFLVDSGKDGIIATNLETQIVNNNSTAIPVILDAFELTTKKDVLGRVGFFKDLRKKILQGFQMYESEKSIAESKYMQHVSKRLSHKYKKIESLLETTELDNDLKELLLSMKQDISSLCEVNCSESYFTLASPNLILEEIISEYDNIDSYDIPTAKPIYLKSDLFRDSIKKILNIPKQIKKINAYEEGHSYKIRIEFELTDNCNQYDNEMHFLDAARIIKYFAGDIQCQKTKTSSIFTIELNKKYLEHIASKEFDEGNY